MYVYIVDVYTSFKALVLVRWQSREKQCAAVAAGKMLAHKVRSQRGYQRWTYNNKNNIELHEHKNKVVRIEMYWSWSTLTGCICVQMEYCNEPKWDKIWTKNKKQERRKKVAPNRRIDH